MREERRVGHRSSGIGPVLAARWRHPVARPARAGQQARAQAARLGVPVTTTSTAAVEHALALAHGQMLFAAETVAELPAERLVVTDRSGATRVCGQAGARGHGGLVRERSRATGAVRPAAGPAGPRPAATGSDRTLVSCAK